jgi:hypothetical protein
MKNNIIIRPAKIDDCSGITILTNQLGYPSSIEKVCEVLNIAFSNKGIIISKPNMYSSKK